MVVDDRARARVDQVGVIQSLRRLDEQGAQLGARGGVGGEVQVAVRHHVDHDQRAQPIQLSAPLHLRCQRLAAVQPVDGADRAAERLLAVEEQQPHRKRTLRPHREDARQLEQQGDAGGAVVGARELQARDALGVVVGAERDHRPVALPGRPGNQVDHRHRRASGRCGRELAGLDRPARLGEALADQGAGPLGALRARRTRPDPHQIHQVLERALAVERVGRRAHARRAAAGDAEQDRRCAGQEPEGSECSHDGSGWYDGSGWSRIAARLC